MSSEAITLEPIDALTVTTLVDNAADLLLVDQGPATRPPLALSAYPGVPARFLEGGTAADALRAEHGFSCLVDVERAGRSVRILFDTGRRPTGSSRTCAASTSRPRDIDVIVLSHGHWDHTTGMDGLVAELGRARTAGPDPPGLLEPPPDRAPGPRAGRAALDQPRALEGAGFEIVEQRQPSFLLDGSLLVTGEVDRTTDFERGFPVHEAHRDGALAARPADPRRPGARRERARPRAGRPHRLRPLRASSTSCATCGG